MLIWGESSKQNPKAENVEATILLTQTFKDNNYSVQITPIEPDATGYRLNLTCKQKANGSFIVWSPRGTGVDSLDIKNYKLCGININHSKRIKVAFCTIRNNGYDSTANGNSINACNSENISITDNLFFENGQATLNTNNYKYISAGIKASRLLNSKIANNISQLRMILNFNAIDLFFTMI